jgi:hypothetical protein
MTLFNARALAALVTVAGGALSRRLPVIMSALVRVVEDDQDEELRAAVDEAIRALFASISDAEGLNTLMMLLLGWCVSRPPAVRSSNKFYLGQNTTPQNVVLALAVSLRSFVKNPT